jgi:hypothetical protein
MPRRSALEIKRVEYFLATQFHKDKPLMGRTPARSVGRPRVPEREEVMILPLDEISKRKDPLLRLPRQAAHFNNLFSHILEVKDNDELRAALAAHFDRLRTYYVTFMSGPEQSPETEPDD